MKLLCTNVWSAVACALRNLCEGSDAINTHGMIARKTANEDPQNGSLRQICHQESSHCASAIPRVVSSSKQILHSNLVRSVLASSLKRLACQVKSFGSSVAGYIVMQMSDFMRHHKSKLTWRGVEHLHQPAVNFNLVFAHKSEGIDFVAFYHFGFKIWHVVLFHLRRTFESSGQIVHESNHVRLALGKQVHGRTDKCDGNNHNPKKVLLGVFHGADIFHGWGALRNGPLVPRMAGEASWLKSLYSGFCETRETETRQASGFKGSAFRDRSCRTSRAVAISSTPAEDSRFVSSSTERIRFIASSGVGQIRLANSIWVANTKTLSRWISPRSCSYSFRPSSIANCFGSLAGGIFALTSTLLKRLTLSSVQDLSEALCFSPEILVGSCGVSRAWDGPLVSRMAGEA